MKGFFVRSKKRELTDIESLGSGKSNKQSYKHGKIKSQKEQERLSVDKRKLDAAELAELVYDIFKETESSRIMKEGQI